MLKPRTIKLMLASAVLAAAGAFAFQHFNKPAPSETARLVEQYQIKRHFGMAWGTYWTHCGVGLSADHVFREVRTTLPEGFEEAVSRDPRIDVAWLGEWACDAPEEPREGQRVIIVGFPAGADEPSHRDAVVYFKRSVSGSDGYETPTWIAIMEETTDEPVVGGMSGSPVIDRETGEPVGILVTSNSPTELDSSRLGMEFSADFVALTDAVRVLNE